MEIKGIKYTAPLFDASGYAQASRGYVLALHKMGIPITINPVSFEKMTPDLSEDAQILYDLQDKKIDYNVNLVHLTPEFWEKFYEPDKFNIGYTVWETSRLHPDWPGWINKMDAVMCSSEFNIDVFKDSGVVKPVFSVPHGIDMTKFEDTAPYSVSGIKSDAFKFYSIFQFTERKHPVALIKSYWHAFQNGENVALILKTYRSNFDDKEKEIVRQTVKRLKDVTPMDNHPPIYLVLDMLSRDQVLGLHKAGDCFISLDRGEGFGLCGFEAGAFGKPIIVTGFGGATEYAKEDNSFKVGYTLTPVSGMPWCISLNSLVKYYNGYRDIYIKAKELKKDDNVKNKNLNSKHINKIEFRPLIENEVVYSLKYFSMPDPVELTGDHKLYVLDDDNTPIKKKVDEINVGDYLYVPMPSTHEWLVVDIKFANKQDKLFYLFGLYSAEGYIDRNKKYIGFCFNINEKCTLGAKCKEYVHGLFGESITHTYERDLEDRNGYEVVFYTTDEIMDLFENKLGCGSHDKFISCDIKYSSRNYKWLEGYWDGDGHIRKEGYKNKKTGKRRISPECIVETASFDLAMDLRDVLLSLGIAPSIYNDKRDGGRLCYVISVSNEKFDKLFGIKANRFGSRFRKEVSGGFGVLITKKELLEDYDDLICSISVDCDNDEDEKDGGSYILNGIASSNCPWYRGDQLWAEPDCMDAIETMRYVYENQNKAKEIGRKLYSYISDNLTWDKVGKKMIDIIKEL